MAYEPNASRSRAVLIGVYAYEHRADFANLPSVRTNVRKLHEVLTDRTLGRMLRTTVEAPRESCTRDEALRLIRTSAAQATDLLLVYFAGHGYMDVLGDELYLMTRESSRRTARTTGIPYTGLLAELARSRAERVVLILDCCCSGNAKLESLDDRKFSLLVSSRPRSIIYGGDGIAPTPFTAALLKLLTTGTHEDGSVTVQSLGQGLKEIAEAEAAAIDPDADYDPWVPREVSSGGAGDTVLSAARHHHAEPWWRAAASRAGQRLRRVIGYLGFCWKTWAWGPGQPWWHRLLAGVVITAALAGLGMGVLTATRPEPLCPTPLELRALTSPETRDALAAVADAFRTSQEDLRPLGGRPAGCYQINVTVQAAPSDQTVAAFSDSAAWAEPQLACPQPGSTASPCPEPLRDVGPHPDVWLPASATEYQRVADAVRRPESAVSLGVPFTVARSPAVLAVSRRDGLTGRARAGETDADLVRAATAQGFTVRGAAPLSSDTALVHALHLPAGTGTDDPAPRGDDTAVICDAATATGQRRALLITEAEAAALFDPTMPGRPSCLGQYADPYTAYYPRDVPGLDLTFVPVTWRDAHADTAQRTEAVRRFAQWLRSPDGLRELGREGFRGADPKARPTTAPLLRDVFVRDPGPPPPPPPAADVDALVRRYGQPGGRRDVLFAVDVSTSSYSGSRAATIRSVLSAAVGGLAADDRYGIAAIPGSTGTDGHPAAPLPLGTHPAADAHRAIGALTAVDDDAPIAAALTGWSDQLARDHAGLPLLVLITDDEDSRGISRPPRGDVPVVVVSTEEFGCKLDFNIELTRAKGACLDASQDLPGRIGRTIAQLTATGGTG